MAQSTILASGTTEATSTDVVIAAGDTAIVGIFVPSGELSKTSYATVYVDSPGADVEVVSLSKKNPITQLYGPATYRVKRFATATAIGIWLET